MTTRRMLVLCAAAGAALAALGPVGRTIPGDSRASPATEAMEARPTSPALLGGRRAGASDLRVEPATTLRLGEVRMGETARGSFVVRNDGTGAARVSLTARCGCVRAGFRESLQELGAGQVAHVDVELETGNKVGVVHEIVVLHSDQLDMPTTALAVSVQVVGGVSVRLVGPRHVVSVIGEHPNVEILLKASVDLPAWSIDRVECTDISGDSPTRLGALEFVAGSSGEGGERRVRVRLPRTDRTGVHRVSLELHTSVGSAIAPSLVFAYMGAFAVRSAVQEANVGLIAEGAPSSCRVRILGARPDLGFSVISATVKQDESALDLEQFHTSVERDEVGWLVDVRHVGPVHGPRRVRGTLIIETTSSAVPQIEVPVVGLRPSQSQARSANQLR